MNGHTLQVCLKVNLHNMGETFINSFKLLEANRTKSLDICCTFERFGKLVIVNWERYNVTFQ